MAPRDNSAQASSDHGMTQLGLLMQLAGQVMLYVAILFALFLIFARTPTPWTLGIFLLGATSAIRSSFHWKAGSALLYHTEYAAKAVRNYVVVAAVQTVAVLVVANKFFPGAWQGAELVGVALCLLSWPAFVAAYLGTGARKSDLVVGIQVPSDCGFEGTGVFMRYFGAAGLLFCVLLGAVLGLVILDGVASSQAWFGLVLLAALGYRSAIHFRAGLRITRGVVSPESACSIAERYWNPAIVISFCVAGGLLVQVFIGGVLSMSGLLVAVLLCAGLLAWPTILRRFFSDRAWNASLAEEHEAVPFTRAPDAGILALAFLFIAHSLPRLTYNLPVLLFGAEKDALPQNNFLGAFQARATALEWVSLALAAGAVACGVLLLRKSARARAVTMGYSAVAVLVIAYLEYPIVQTMRGGAAFAFDGQRLVGQLVVYAGLAIELLLPVTALFLLRRDSASLARAQVRPQRAGSRSQST